MTNNFNYKEVRGNYVHCLNAQCPRASECLRFMAAQHADAKIAAFQVVNPNFIASHEECSYFHSDQLIRYAVGITRLFNNIPYSKIRRIKGSIQAYFGRSTYYRIYRKERYITPNEQDFVRALFLKEGIQEEPMFDEYIDTHAWY